jgi:CAAX protease family protein
MDGDSSATPPEAERVLNLRGSGLSMPPSHHKIGLGAGWRLLLYGAFFFLLWSISIFLLRQLLRPAIGVFSPSFDLSGELASFLAAFFAAWMMAQFEERPVEVYGLPTREAFGKRFGQGCLFGACSISALIGLIAAFGGYSFGGLAEHGTMIAKWALYWAAFFVVVGLFEEFFFRGYTLYTLTEGIGFWPAAMVLSACFGAIHLQNSGEGWTGAAGVAFVGLFWSFTLKRTGSLWFAVGMHATFDFGETFLYSVPDSGVIFPGHLSNATLHGPRWLTGGSTGPEASVFDFLLLTALFLIVHFVFPAQRQEKSAAATS